MSGILGGQAILLLLVHLFGDFYSAFYYALVPYLTVRLELTLTATGALATLLTCSTSYFQPLAGMIEDRLGRRTALVAALALAAVGSGLLGFVWDLPSLCVMLIVGAIGVGLFHPVGAAIAGRGGSGNRVAAIALYVVGGSIGVVIAPLLVPQVAAVGFRWIAALAIPGLIFAAVLWMQLRVEDELSPHPRNRLADIWTVFRKLWPIHLDVVLRFIPITAYFMLLPLLAKLRGRSEAASGQSLAFAMLVGAAGVLGGGWLGARISGRRMVVLSEIGAAAAWFLAPMTQGVLFYVLLAIGSFLVYLVTPLQIASAQRLAPQTASAASGLVMGFAGGNAGLMMLPLGRLGDYWTATTGSKLLSVTGVLQVSALFLLVAAAASLLLRSHLAEPEPVEAKG